VKKRTILVSGPGSEGVRLVVSVDHEEIKAAISRELPGAG
jgi:hypothetical protein